MIGFKPSPKREESTAGEEAPKNSLIEFTPPNGLDLSGKADGDQFEVVAELRVKGGKLCLVSVNGIPLSGYEKPKPAPAQPLGFEDAVEQGLSA